MHFKLYEGKTPVAYIDKAALLSEMLERLEDYGLWALDIEFDRNRYHYGFNICLLQLYAGGNCYIVDPIRLGDSVEPLWRALENPAVEKILHSGDEDLQLLKHLQCDIQNIKDTAWAAKLLNYERSSLSSLIEDKFGITINKKFQKSNWHTRPLAEEQIVYSATDVIYLPDLRQLLAEELDKLGRLSWWEQECEYLRQKPYVASVTDQLTKHDRKQFNYKEQYVLEKLLQFRDAEARRYNKPPAQILGNEQIREWLQNPLPDLATWGGLKGLYHAIKTAEFHYRLSACLDLAKEEAELLPEPQTEPRRSGGSAEIARRNMLKEVVFKPLQDWLSQHYGEHLMRHLLSGNTIDQITAGYLKISGMGRPYCIELIGQAAEAQKIDLSEFW